MMSLTVMRAGPEHAGLARQAILEIHRRTPLDEEALAAFLADRSCYLYVAVAEGEVVGSLNGYALRHPERRQPQFLLYEIDVRDSWRGQGIGTALVSAFVAEARAAGAFEVWVLTNESNGAAMAMYRKCGFERRNPDDVMLSAVL